MVFLILCWILDLNLNQELYSSTDAIESVPLAELHAVISTSCSKDESVALARHINYLLFKYLIEL
jgi:hypothetical protein